MFYFQYYDYSKYDYSKFEAEMLKYENKLAHQLLIRKGKTKRIKKLKTQNKNRTFNKVLFLKYRIK